MEFGEMKRNTSNWSNFGMLLRRASLTASAGLSCCSSDTAAHSDYFVLMRLLNTLTHSLTPEIKAL